jgi:hypothetical protein
MKLCEVKYYCALALQQVQRPLCSATGILQTPYINAVAEYVGAQSV